MIRPYIDEKIHQRVLKYAASIGFKPHTQSGIGEVYAQLINSVLDESGNPKNGIILTEAQRNEINKVSQALGQPHQKVTNDLINFAMMVFGSDITLRAVLLRAAPLMMDELVEKKSGVAQEILEDIKKELKSESKLNPQAALRYEDSPGSGD